jgi:hypothetical protein
MNIEYESTQKYLDKMNYILGSRNESLQRLPTFAEYNSTEQASRRKQTESKILDKFINDFNSLYNSVEVDIKNLNDNIFKAKYPSLSKPNVLDANTRLYGSMEYQNAIELLKFISPNYPKPEIQEYYSQGRYDFVSSLIDLALKKATPDGMYPQREDFIKSVNELLQKMGVLDMMKAKLELQWVLEQLKIQYYSASATYGGENNKHLIQFGVMDMMAEQNLKQAIAELTL